MHHNSNVPPNDQGLLAAPDVQRLQELRRHLARAFAVDLARGKPALATSVSPGSPAVSAVDGQPGTHWSPAEGEKSASLEVDLGQPAAFNVVMLQEQIAQGQRVEEYRVEAWTDSGWQSVATGKTIGHMKLDRVPEVKARKVRLTLLRWQSCPMIRTFGLYHASAVAREPEQAERDS